MDLLDSVRDLRSDVDNPSDAELAAATARLEATIAAERRPPRRRRRGFAWAGALTGVAIAAASALVVASVIGAGPEPRLGARNIAGIAPANAATVLNDAAKLAPRSAPAQLGPGQYLRVESDSAGLTAWHPDPDRVGRVGATAAWITHNSEVVYMPADQSGTWVVQTNASPVSITGKSGTDVDAAIAAEQKLNPGMDASSVQYLPGGLYDSGASDHHEIRIGSPAGNTATMPADPADFMPWLRQQLFPEGASGEAFIEESEYDAIVASLQSNVLPANQRAMLFKALALLPDVRLVSTSGALSTLQLSGDHGLDRIVIDTSTGLLTRREMYFGPAPFTAAVGVVPANTPDVVTTITTSVVDGLPAALRTGLPH